MKLGEGHIIGKTERPGYWKHLVSEIIRNYDHGSAIRQVFHSVLSVWGKRCVESVDTLN